MAEEELIKIWDMVVKGDDASTLESWLWLNQCITKTFASTDPDVL